jgi:GT2 family glycosyltransferase
MSDTSYTTTKTQPSVLAIVLNWQQPTVTVSCVQSLQAMQYPSLDILIVDNGSNDDSLQVFQTELPNIHLLALDNNGGFANGVNEGLRFALSHNYDYALLINNDAFAAPNMLTRLLAETNPDIAMLSPKIYYETERNRIWFANGRQHPCTLDLLDTGRGEIDNPKWLQSRDTDYLLGTCLLVKLAIVLQIGLMDERYFMYFEDLDWSIRMRQAGYRLRLVSNAHLYHLVSVSTGGRADTPIRRYHLARSGIIFWRTHLRHGNPILIILFRIVSALKTIIRLTLSGKITVLRSFFRGLCDGWAASNTHCNV